MSQDVIGSPQIGTTTNGTAGAAESSNDAHLVVIIGQTTSADDVKLTLTYLNASLVQIGQPIKEHLTDIVNSVRHKQFEKSHYDQQQRIGYSNDVNFTFELLVNPLVRSVRQSLVNVATSPRKHKFVVNLSGDRSCQGDVNCADASLACDDFLTLLANPLEVNDEQRKQLKQAPHKLTLLMPARVVDGNRAWKQALERQYAGVSVQSIVVNSNSSTSSSTLVLPENVELNEALTPLLNQSSVDQLMQSSRHTGTLKMARPALYIFPSLQGDSAYFALNGYSMLINGGYDRLKPCFWKFVNMLQQIDSVLVTHADVDSLGGLAAFFAKKAAAEPDCKPSVLTLLGNLVHSNNKYAQQAAQLINAELGAAAATKLTPQTDVDLILEAIDKLKIKLLPLYKNNESLLLPFNKSQNAQNKYEHINLYSKLGHGSLDLYVLSPYVNSSEYKEFYQQQQQNFARQTTASANMQKSHLAVHGVFKQLPLSHLASAVCLLVWLPAPAPRGSTESNQALRLLFTGNAPQHVIINALEKVKELELLSEPVYRVKPEPGQHQPAQQQHQSMKKQVSSSATGVSSSAAKENGHHGSGGGGGSKLNTSISNKPVGTANGHHNESENVSKAASAHKPPVPTQSSGKPQASGSNKPPKPTTTTSSNSGVALNASSSSGGGGQSKDVKKSTEKTTTTTTTTSANKETAVKKKPAPMGGDHANDHEKESKSGKDEKPPVAETKTAKKPAVPKRESTSNGHAVKPSHSDTNASSGSAPTRSSLSSHTVNNATGASSGATTSKSETTSKPEPKPAVPKQKQPASKPTEKSAGGETTKPATTKPESKRPTTSTSATTKTDKSVPQSVKKPAEKTSGGGGGGGPKTLTLSMEAGGGVVLKGGVTAAPAPSAPAAEVVTSSAPVEPSDVVIQQQQQQQQQQQPASVESIETAMHNEEEEAKHDDRQRQEDVVVQHVEHVEQIEKIEQVTSVEQVVEEIIPAAVAAPSTPVLPTAETIQQEMNGGGGGGGDSNNGSCNANNYFGHHESPNLSPVKKEFGALNHSSVESSSSSSGATAAAAAAGPSEVAVVEEGGVVHEEAPVVEEQLTSETVTTGEIEIVSGNLNGDAAGGDAAVELLMRPADDDVMTRSFIEDDACPGSNPFAAPVLQPTPVRHNNNNNGSDAAPSATNGNHHLNESCDLNRTHELFDGDESSSSINTASNNTNGNGVDETNGGSNGVVRTNGNGAPVDDLDDKIISGLEALKLANQQQAAAAAAAAAVGNHNGEEYNGNTNGNGVVQEEPRNWNLLELPKPVNPADHLVPADVSDKVEIDAKPDLTSSPAATSGPSSTLAGGSDKKPTTSVNGKSKQPSGGRPSVDPSSKQQASTTTTTTTTTTTAAANNTTTTTTTKAAGRPVPPIHPAYVELTYVPAHGSEHHVDAEFFKRVRARHYVLSALEPSEHVLNALCEGKEVWEDKQLQVTLIPTYETDALRKWYVQNEERLARLKIDVSPAACHATITMDDNPELTCQVYKLEF